MPVTDSGGLLECAGYSHDLLCNLSWMRMIRKVEVRTRSRGVVGFETIKSRQREGSPQLSIIDYGHTKF